MAESLVNGRVRKTEILITGRRADGSMDFAAYDEAGRLAASREFASGAGALRPAATPYACMACHYDKDTLRFSVLFPM